MASRTQSSLWGHLAFSSPLQTFSNLYGSVHLKLTTGINNFSSSVSSLVSHPGQNLRVAPDGKKGWEREEAASSDYSLCRTPECLLLLPLSLHPSWGHAWHRLRFWWQTFLAWPVGHGHPLQHDLICHLFSRKFFITSSPRRVPFLFSSNAMDFLYCQSWCLEWWRASWSVLSTILT